MFWNKISQIIFQEHSWFAAIDWDLLLKRKLEPLYVPPLKGPEDVSLFDKRFTTAPLTQESPTRNELIFHFPTCYPRIFETINFCTTFSHAIYV